MGKYIPLATIEEPLRYSGYRDSHLQRILNDKFAPFYLFDGTSDAEDKISRFIDTKINPAFPVSQLSNYYNR